MKGKGLWSADDGGDVGEVDAATAHAVGVLLVDGVERQHLAVVRPAGVEVAAGGDGILRIGPEGADVIALLSGEVVEEEAA